MSINGRNGLNAVLKFGKHKGKTIGELVATGSEGVGYLVWLREEKKKAGDATFFTGEIHSLLNDAIGKSRSLKSKYRVWTPEEMPAVMPVVAVAGSYEGWGAF